ncbi:MAG: putative HNHc nuclease [Marinobacter sp.]|nr:putative HNHc nuclease [Marinobacter sp.]
MKRRAKRKPRAGDNRSYLDWVKTQPCVICQRPADDPHHIIGAGLSGMGMTAPDLLAMPVCREHHNEIHESPDLWARQFEWVVRTIAKAVSAGEL